ALHETRHTVIQPLSLHDALPICRTTHHFWRNGYGIYLPFREKCGQLIRGGRNMAVNWKSVKDYQEIKYEKYNGIAKVTMNRPRKHNAFTPLTVNEMIDAFADARDESSIGVIILTGAGEKAFCSGGDQTVRGHGGYVGTDQVPRLNVLDLQRLMRTIPKPVIAMVAGYAIG